MRPSEYRSRRMSRPQMLETCLICGDTEQPCECVWTWAIGQPGRDRRAYLREHPDAQDANPNER